jgi:photosystem II stability/assembly factor-like uncharacterized protein
VAPAEINTDASLHGLSIVNGNVVWVSGTGGTFVRTTDGGETWQAGTVAGAEKLDFRDVYAIDGETAYLMSIGKGNESRIYKTTDAGKNWLLEYTEQNPKAFLDCMAFWDATHGIVVGAAARTGRRFSRTRYLRQRTVKARRPLEPASQRMLRRKGERKTGGRGS